MSQISGLCGGKICTICGGVRRDIDLEISYRSKSGMGSLSDFGGILGSVE